jgi:hypothetical protein
MKITLSVLFFVFSLPPLLCSRDGGEVDARRTTIAAERLLERLVHYQPNIRQPGIYPLNALLDGKSVEVRETDSILTFVGIQLIPDVIKKEYNKLYFDFAERYWLELLLFCDNNADVSKKLKEDNVDIQVDGNLYDLSFPTIGKIINSLEANQVSISETDSLCRVSWKDHNGKTIVLQFRKRIEQVLGMNKRELEYHFYANLNAYPQPDTTQPDTTNFSSLLFDSESGIFVKKGETYQIREMISDQYWQKTNDGRFQLLFDRSYIPETISNLFTNGQYIENEIILNLEQRYYTSKTMHYECRINKLASFMKNENNNIYVGIDKVESDKITGVVIYENRDYKYNHALYFSAPYSIFEHRTGYIDATIYTYIPMHNVQNLFDNRKQTK